MQRQRIHQEIIKKVKTEQKQNYRRKFEISKPVNAINTFNNKQDNNKISYIENQKNQNMSQIKPQPIILINRKAPNSP